MEGGFHLPYIADENSDEDPELKVSTATEGQAEKLAKQAFTQHKDVRPSAGGPHQPCWPSGLVYTSSCHMCSQAVSSPAAGSASLCQLSCLQLLTTSLLLVQL